ncbi:MAG: hypothetical protein ACK5MK_06485 [Dysgonomonas sp.]
MTEETTKTVTVILHAYIQRNSKFVRGMKAVREYIEQNVLYFYQGESIDENKWRFVVTYTTNKDLKETFDKIYSDICDEADYRNCFIDDYSFRNEKTGYYWDEYNAQWLTE